jgi:hypothetical protein
MSMSKQSSPLEPPNRPHFVLNKKPLRNPTLGFVVPTLNIDFKYLLLSVFKPAGCRLLHLHRFTALKQ